MSKPLIFVFQIVGLFLLASGAGRDPWGGGMVFLGVVLIVIGGIGIRKRFKRG